MHVFDTSRLVDNVGVHQDSLYSADRLSSSELSRVYMIFQETAVPSPGGTMQTFVCRQLFQTVTPSTAREFHDCHPAVDMMGQETGNRSSCKRRGKNVHNKHFANNIF